MKQHAVLLLLAVVGCDNGVGDVSPPDADIHSALGPGVRLRDVQNPANKMSGQVVNVSGAVTIAIDTYDETHNGKSLGTVFIQDADANTSDKMAAQYSGISMYAPSYIPANLRLAPGDVLTVNGQYNEQTMIGSTVNFSPDFLPQMYKPQVSQSFETPLPQPVVITLADLADFQHARPYLGMLVQLQDIVVPYAPVDDGTGRVHAALTPAPGAPAIANELYDLTTSPDGGTFAPNTHFTSITGVLDFFFTFFICPRSAADLVQ